MDFPHDGLPVFWRESANPSCREPSHPYDERSPVVQFSRRADRIGRQKRSDRRVIRGSPVARGIRRLDFRAQGCPQHAVLAPGSLVLCGIREAQTETVLRSLSFDLRRWIDDQADAGHPSGDSPAPGLLAVEKDRLRYGNSMDKNPPGKNPFLSARRPFGDGDFFGPTPRRSGGFSDRYPLGHADRELARSLSGIFD